MELPSMLATRPFFALALWFMLGVAICGICSPHWRIVLVAASVLLGIGGLMLVLQAPRMIAFGACVAAVAAGGLRYAGSVSPGDNDISRFAPARYARIDGFVASDPDVRAGRASFYLSVEKVVTGGIASPASGQAFVSVSLFRRGRNFDLHDGDRVQVDGALDVASGLSNPGQETWAVYLARRGIWSGLYVRGLNQIVVLNGEQPNWFRAVAWTLRSALLCSLRSVLPGVDSQVLAGVLLGLRGDLPADLLNAFAATGTIHILATAGLHVSILCVMVLAGLSAMTVHRKLAAVGTIGFLWIYDLMAGGRIAVTRAVIMATILLIAIIVERAPDILNSLGAAALVILSNSPGQLLDTGFQASFAAVLMIALMMPLWGRLWEATMAKTPGRWLRLCFRRAVELVGLTLFAQMGAAPIIAHAFNIVVLAGSLANLVVVPILFYLIPVGLVVAVLGMCLHTPAAILAHWLVSPAIKLIIAVVTRASHAPFASTVIASPGAFQIAAYYVIACVVSLRTEAWLWKMGRQSKIPART